MNSTQAFIGLGMAFVGGVALGAGIGYRVATSKLDLKYNEQMEAEIARTREYYEKKNKAGDFESPASAAEKLGIDPGLNEAAEALLTYKGEGHLIKKDGVEVLEVSLNTEPNPFTEAAGIESIQDAEIVEEEHNVFEDAGDIGFSERNPERPYLITMIEFGENEPDYDQVSITYYAGDKVVVDDKDKPIADADRCVGLDNLQKFGTMPDPTIILVRNERLRMDYEVNLREGKYAHEVLGLMHSDEPFERRMRHPRREE